ncbi:MAG: FAD-dependent monooxygenase [Balneolaceae bacterium]
MTDSNSYPVMIVGGGPVGLFLALSLTRSGIRCKVLEKRSSVDRRSKSIGIHPVSLELFDELGITGEFLSSGLKIHRGHAFIGGKRVGDLSFESCSPPHNYILAIPQYRTEEILENALRKVDPECLTREADVSAVRRAGQTADVFYSVKDELFRSDAEWVIGCDGKNSIVRRSAGIPSYNRSYPDTYIMGDFTDNTLFGNDAAVYLHRDGLIESFPLPGGKRRWVAKTDRYIENPDGKQLHDLIGQRLNRVLPDQSYSRISSFGVQHLLASNFRKNRCLLAGDSAHIVSPIGGQGMNLGFITGRHLATALQQIFSNPAKADSLLADYSAKSRRIAGQVSRRAEMNMRLGREYKHPLVRHMLVRTMIMPPFQQLTANAFTMRGLDKWPV